MHDVEIIVYYMKVEYILYLETGSDISEIFAILFYIFVFDSRATSSIYPGGGRERELDKSHRR
jgi:hypothetical protein